MAMSTRCCSIPSARPPTSPLSNNVNKTQLARPRRDILWRKQCILGGLACVILTVQTGNLIGTQETAMAAESMQSISTSKELVNKRWSDKRACPPWQLNSLETIVPENLPRPSFHRKLEAAGFSKTAPPMKVTTRNIISNCFST